MQSSRGDAVEPFLSRVLLQRLDRRTIPDHWQADGTTVFVDISGFTKLSERLARRGREGAEDITEAINACFGPLLSIAIDQGGSLLKFGGDALLLLFDTEDHLMRACGAAGEMRRTLRTVGRIDLPGARVNLRMSVGIHTGPLDLFLVGDSHREMIVAGPAASEVVATESSAGAGQILLSAATVRALGSGHVGQRVGQRGLLTRFPSDLEPVIDARPRISDVDAMVEAIPLGLRSRLEAFDLSPEHRMATIAFVQFTGTDDLVRHSGPDAAATALHQLVSTIQACVDDLQVGFLGSDVSADGGKIILTTGVPTNTGNDEERMLYALRRIARADLPLPVRMGVNRGPVFAGPVGTARRRTYTVMGDAVNLAARLMARAETAQVVATPSVLDESDTLFATEPLEPFRVKGKSEPVTAVLLGRRTGLRRVGAELDPFPLVGRDAELAVLTDALGRAVQGEGSFIDMVGEAGIGKSRLMEEMRARATDVLCIGGTCETYSASTPYFVWREVLRDAIGAGWDDSDAEVIVRLESLVERLDPSLMPWLPMLVIPFDVSMAPTPEVEAVAVEFRRPRMFEVVTQFLGVLLHGPTLAEFDNAHFMDEASCALLEHLSERVGEHPWLFCVMRQEHRGGFSGREESATVTRLEPSPIDAEAARSLALTATEDAPMGPALLDSLADRSGGNPQYLRDLVLAARSGSDELPDSIEAAAVARIDRLSSGDRALVRRAALLGQSFQPDHLAWILPADVAMPDEGTWARLDHMFIPDGDGYRRFSREVLRDAAYGGLPYRTRRELHSIVARRIERDAGADAPERSESLSVHYELAGLPDETWRWSCVAGDRAVEHFAPFDASRFYKRAIDAARILHPSDAELATVFEKLGEAYDRSGEFDRAHAAIASARRRVGGSQVQQARLLELHASVAERSGRFLSAVRWARRGLRTLDGQSGEEAERRRARLLASLATIRMRQRRLGDATRLAREAIVVAESSGELSALARANQTLEVALVESGRPADGRHARRALELFEDIGDLFGQSAVLNNMGGVAYWEGRWTQAVELYERATDVSSRAGMVVDAAFGDFNVGEILIDQGHLDDGSKRVRAAEIVWRGTGDAHGAVFASALLSRAAARAGRYDVALASYAEAIESHRALRADADARAVEVESLECLLGLGRAAEALAGAEQVLSEAGEVVAFVLPGLHRTRGLALAMFGRGDDARVELGISLDEARRHDSPFELARTLDAIAAVGDLHQIGVDAAEAADLRRRRDEIYGHLGVVRPVPLPPGIIDA